MAITWTINNEMDLASADPETSNDYVCNITFVDVEQGINHTRNSMYNNKSDTDEGIAEIQAQIEEQIQPQHDAGTLPNETQDASKFKKPDSNTALVSGTMEDKRPTLASFKK